MIFLLPRLSSDGFVVALDGSAVFSSGLTACRFAEVFGHFTWQVSPVTIHEDHLSAEHTVFECGLEITSFILTRCLRLILARLLILRHLLAGLLRPWGLPLIALIGHLLLLTLLSLRQTLLSGLLPLLSLLLLLLVLLALLWLLTALLRMQSGIKLIKSLRK